MNKLNNKGFTLVEVIAVVAIIAIIGLIAIPNVINTVNTSNQASYDIMVENITIASKQLFEEIAYMDNEVYIYNSTGKTSDSVQISSNNEITVKLQTLVSNGFLTGSNNPDKDGSNKNYKIITNPKTKEDIGSCEIIITKNVGDNFNTSYSIVNNSTSNNNCPTSDEYAEVLN